MKKSLKTQIHINASPAIVWSILTDFSAYKYWNPFVRELTGNTAIGGKFKVRLTPPNGKPMSFKPVMQTWIPNREFMWLGHFLFKGLFDGQHRFELIEQPDGSTLFIHSEAFDGILVPLFAGQLDTVIKKGFEAMNEKLKAVAESQKQ